MPLPPRPPPHCGGSHTSYRSTQASLGAGRVNVNISPRGYFTDAASAFSYHVLRRLGGAHAPAPFADRVAAQDSYSGYSSACLSHSAIRLTGLISRMSQQVSFARPRQPTRALLFRPGDENTGLFLGQVPASCSSPAFTRRRAGPSLGDTAERALPGTRPAGMRSWIRRSFDRRDRAQPARALFTQRRHAGNETQPDRVPRGAVATFPRHSPSTGSCSPQAAAMAS